MKRLLLITLTIAATLLGLFLLWFFGPVLAVFGASLAISAALRPLVARLEARGLGRGLAILIYYLIMLAVLGGVLAFYAINLSLNITQAQQAVPLFYEQQRSAWARGSGLGQALAQALPRDFTSFWSGLSTFGLQNAGFSDLLNAIVNALVFLLAVLSLTFYWLMEITRFERLWLSLLPVASRIRARDIWRNAERAVGTYMRSTVSAIVVATIMLYVFYALLGIPLSATWALIGGLAHLIPRIGPALGVLPAVLIALTYSPTAALGALLTGAVVQIAVHHLNEYLMRAESVRVNPLVQVLLLLALATLGGFPLLVYAPPLAALLQSLYPNLLALNANQSPQSAVLDLLHDRLATLQRELPPDSLALNNALKRSDELLGQARVILKEQ